ncbi:MAG: CBS domain-containing protein [Spirochaetes bacterium]|nr:CBS domain-containing protein [Spirochaetota bacterium]MBU1080011.1 CBS domain-containing protein [Spirochaetota bacterium]
MKIIVGHGNMDLDCIGSIVLAKYLFPDHVPVKSYLVHPVARKLMNLYADRLGFWTTADLKGQAIERAVVVDTCAMSKIEEYFRGVPDAAAIEFEVFDHHPAERRDIPAAKIHERPFGANTTQLGLELIAQGVFIEPEDATIALTGLYADTGNFTHPNVSREDFEVAAFLLSQGASLTLVKDFLVPLREKQQIVLFHEILNLLENRSIRGHVVQVCYLELETDAQGLGAVIEQVFEVEHGEILFGFFFFKKKAKMLIIGRNNNARLSVDEILRSFGGGGHRQAASATVKTEEGRAFAERTLSYLEAMLEPAATARDIMTEIVDSVDQESSLLDASIFLESVSHTGAPVCDSEGRLVGFLTLRDIMKGRKGGQMHVPVRTYMTKSVVTAGPDTTVRDIDELLFEKDVGHLPIVEDGRIVGMVTRGDLLAFKRNDRRRKAELLGGLGIDGPGEARVAPGA